MTSKDYQKHLNRLKEEQQRALKETEDNIKQWEKFRSDYDALKNRLKTLPDSLSYDVMVPFGKMGFMPGRLVHTNEILVLLGDNWFVERSAKQAAEIVSRRTIVVDKQLEDLQKQRKLLEPRRDFTEDLQATAEGGGDVFDICEEYDEEKEKVWREKHKQSVAEHRKKQRKAKDKPRVAGNRQQQGQPTDAQLWQRLDELERIELREREMEKSDSDIDSGVRKSDFRESDSSLQRAEQGSAGTVALNEHNCKDFDQKYTLSDEESDTSSRSLDSDDDVEEDEDVEEEEGENGQGDLEETLITATGKVIHFSHSKLQEPGGATGDGLLSEPSTIASPADIYARFKPSGGPVSILKKTKTGTTNKGARERRERKRVVGFDTGSEEEGEKPTPVKEMVSRQDLQKAFTGTVKEKVPTNSPDPSSVPQGAPIKPVSKFKMRSANQNPASTSQRVPELPAESGVVKSDSQTTDSVKPVSKFKAQRQKLNPT